MTVGERVKLIRKSDKVNLTMEKFGKVLGVGKTAISLIESGKNKLTDANAKAICREFNVDYAWLTTGEGEMFLSDDSVFMDQFNQIMFGEDRLHKAILKMAITLSTDERKVIEKLIDEYQQYKKEEDD